VNPSGIEVLCLVAVTILLIIVVLLWERNP
jgi:hypothetical protein